MEKFSEKIESKLYPMIEWVQSNKYLSAIQFGLLMTMPVLLVGAFACVISDLPIQAYQDLMISIFGETVWGEWNWSVVNVATMGLTGLIALVGTSYQLAKFDKLDAIPNVAIALMSYFILLPSGEGGIPVSGLGAQALFLVIIVAIITEEIYKICKKKNLTVKMPESVPAFVSQQFTALVPAVVSGILFLVIRYVIAATPYGTASNLVYSLLQVPLTNVGTSLFGTIVFTFLNSFFWLFGIHGTELVSTVAQPLWYAARAANFEVFASSALAARPYIATQDFANMIICLTGTGITLPLCVEMAFLCKSERIKKVGKLSIIPGVFNVNEPVIFGLPLVMNPVMIIPFFLAPMVTVLISFGAMYFGIVPYPTGVTVPWTMPAPFGGWMMCNSWLGGLLQLVVLAVSGVIYYPFIRALDKKYVEEEQAR